MMGISTARLARIGLGLLAAIGLLATASLAEAQYFGRNKVQYDRFEFRVLATEHFDIYYYPEEAEAAATVGRMAERWHTRLSRILGHTLTGRQPVILYASHPHFEQTNVIEGELGEGTGGVTESGKRRVVLPMAASLADTDHVLGHELVHAFQYDMLGRNAGAMPLWFIEGMAEYLSLGPRSVQTAMWLRDAAIQDRLPDLDELDDPRYFPYRFGHAFWAYTAGRWGDDIVGRMLKAISPVQTGEAMPGTVDAIGLVEAATSRDKDQFSQEWHEAIRETYGVAPAPKTEGKAPLPETPLIGERTGHGSVNVGPSLSPDGKKIAFLSAREMLSIDLYLADASTGKIIRKLISTASDPHFESLQFLASAGAWASDNRRLAIGTVRGGRPVLAILDTDRGSTIEEIKFEEIGEVFQPTWAPDGKAIAFSGQVGGVTDLFIYDLDSRQLRRLTKDQFADMQPAWSPDGKRLAFVTDRFSADLSTLAFKGFSLATIDLAEGTIARVESGVIGNDSNPQWAADGSSLFFLSDAGGRSNAYQLDIASGRATAITSAITGISGITPMSPALSVSAKGDLAAVTVFRDSGYEIQIMPPRPAAPLTGPAAQLEDAALLPPTTRASQLVAQQLAQPAAGLPAATAKAEDKEYSPGLELVAVGQQLGVATNSAFGTYVSGGIAFQFSDMLGNHLLSTGFSVQGGVKDIGASASYLNRTRRWNWGVFGERVPLLSGTVRQGFTEVDGETVFVEQTVLFRETYLQAGALTAYPFSRSSRIEFSGAMRHIGFDYEIEERYFDPFTGVFLGEDKTVLPTLDGIKLFDAAAALVRDTSSFGPTGPLVGQRARLEIAPTFGDLRFTNITADFRQYVMPVRPVTLAARVLHAGRYGAGGEDERLSQLFLGYSTLVRGYDVGSFEASECTVTLDGSCPEFDRLLGSRLLVVNLEARAPAVGLFKGRLDYGALPIELFTFFDAGVAWTRAEQPTFTGGVREWVTSAGLGARINLFGYLVTEFNLVRPLNRPGQGWQFVFNLRQGY